MNKYHAKRTEYKGQMFMSKREANFACVLDTMRKAKNPSEKVKDIEYQPKYPIIINGQKICTYIGDFLVLYADGKRVLYDSKGFLTPVYRLKKKLLKATLGIEITEV